MGHLSQPRRSFFVLPERLEPRRLFDGGDFSLDFVAAAPFTYDHTTGGGSFDDRTIGKTNDVVESLEGGDFACDDIVSYLVEINVDSGAVGAQTIELDFEFLSDATGQPGVGLDDIVGVQVNYGAIAQADVDGDSNPDVIGDGPGETDAGINDDGGSVATLTSETPPSNPFHNGTTNLQGTVEVTDLEAGESVILRIDVHIGCDDNASPTGNLQAAITGARVTAPDNDNISVGNQTVPFKNIDELIMPGINVIKTGPELSKIGDQVTYSYEVTNNGNVALDNVVLVDDAGTPGDTGDDFNPTFTGGDTNTDGLLDTDETWTYSKLFTIPVGASDPFTNTATVTANSEGNTEDTTDDQDTHTINLFQPSIDLEKDADVSNAAVGDQIVYSYTVTNDGSSDSPGLSIVSLIDDNGTPADSGDDFTPDTVDLDTDTFNDGDTNTNGLIDVGETWQYTATRTVLNTDDDPLVNTAVVHANPDGFPNDITDSDTAGVNLFQPAIKVVKDGNQISKVGDAVTYTYAVTNESSAGSPALNNVALLDDAGTPGDSGDDFAPEPVDLDTDTFNDGDTNTDGLLDIGETWLYSHTFTVPVGADDPLINTVTATAGVVGSVATVTDTDTHSVDLFQPGITITKDGPASVPAGGTINYTYTLQNTGSSDSPGLSIVSLVDDNGTPGNTGDDFTPDTVDVNTDTFNDGDTNTNGLLDVGETWQYTASRTAPNIGTSITNTVVVHANPDGFPNDITDSDDHTVIVEAPPHEDGRMTGGGSIFLPVGGTPTSGLRVTHGFQLHCAEPSASINNRLEVNWGKPNNHFHLLTLEEVHCSDNEIIQAPPDAPIDTIEGWGYGRFSGKYNGISYRNVRAKIEFVFTDGGPTRGEPGIFDTASYIITVLDGNKNGNANDPVVVLDSLGAQLLRFGNHQAHNELPNLLDSATATALRNVNRTLDQLNNVNLTESKILSLTQKLLTQEDALEVAAAKYAASQTITKTSTFSVNPIGTTGEPEKDLAALLA